MLILDFLQVRPGVYLLPSTTLPSKGQTVNMSLQPSSLLAYQDHYLKGWLFHFPHSSHEGLLGLHHRPSTRVKPENEVMNEADMASAEQNSPLMVSQWRNREMEPPRNRAGGTVTLQHSAYSVFNLADIRNKEGYLMGV